MSTTPRTQPRTTRTVRICGRRLAAMVVLATIAPLTLAACGVLGGGTNHGDAPVEISQDSGSQAPVNSLDAGANGGAVTATQATTQVIVSGGATITRVGVRTQVNTQIRTQVNTKINTQVKTQVNTKISTAPPVTNVVTVTATETRTVTETKNVTVTVTAAAATKAAG